MPPPPAEEDLPELLDAAEAGQLLGVDPTTIHRVARKGRLEVVGRVGSIGRAGGKALFRRADVEALTFNANAGPVRLGQCGFCDRELVDPVEWGALRALVCRECSGALDSRVGEVLVERWDAEQTG